MHVLYFQERRERNHVVHVLAAYMGTVVCASFALICLCSVVRVEESRDQCIKRRCIGITYSVEINFFSDYCVWLYNSWLYNSFGCTCVLSSVRACRL